MSRVCSYVNKSQFWVKLCVWNPIEMKERREVEIPTPSSYNKLTMHYDEKRCSINPCIYSKCYIVTLSMFGQSCSVRLAPCVWVGVVNYIYKLYKICFISNFELQLYDFEHILNYVYEIAT